MHFHLIPNVDTMNAKRSVDRFTSPINNNGNENDNEIYLFRHHNGNNANIKVIFKQVTMLDKCNCI